MEDILSKAQEFKYNSVAYKDSEDIGEVSEENIFDIGNAVFIVEENNKEIQIHWGSETHEAFFDGISNIISFIEKKKKDNKRIFIEFIPPEFIENMTKLNFRVVSEWVDFWANDLMSVDIKPSEFQGIRLIKANEYEKASKVLCSCVGYSREFPGESSEWIKEWNETENNCILVAEKNNTLVGLCCLSIYGFDSEKGPVLWLREIGVSPEYQRQGIGYSLISSAFKWGKANGAKRSFLACDAENCNGIKLYEKFGYSRKEERGQINMAKYYKD